MGSKKKKEEEEEDGVQERDIKGIMRFKGVVVFQKDH